MLICYQIRLSLHACTKSCVTLHTVPQPTVNITANRTGVLYAGTPLTLTCSIQLNPAVDTTVMVTRMWRGPGSQAVSNSSRMTVSNVFKGSDNLYETTIEFHPLSTTDSGNYECEATVAPDPQSQFVIMNTTGSDTHSVTVQGEIQLLNQWLVYTMMASQCIRPTAESRHVVVRGLPKLQPAVTQD